MDPRLKKSAERVFKEIGISTTEAIRLFLKQVELYRGLPFPVSVPNEETVAAMMETNSPTALKRYRLFRELPGSHAECRTTRPCQGSRGRP